MVAAQKVGRKAVRKAGRKVGPKPLSQSLRSFRLSWGMTYGN